IDGVRARFPAVSLTHDGHSRTSLDNPAGTQVPQQVVDACADTLVQRNANLGGRFATSLAAEEVLDSVHRKMAAFLGTDDPGEIILGPNMTTLTLHLSRSICRGLQPGDEIIVTRMDHEGNVAPWLAAAEDNGLVIRWADFSTETWRIEADHFESLLSDRTKVVALNHTSNLTGSTNDVKKLVSLAKQAGAIVYVDAVQYAPHGLIDVVDIGCDFLLCSSYKFFGPHMGIAWGKRSVLEAMKAYKCRCVPESLPVKYETGTPQIELIAGIGGTIDYFARLGERMGGGGSLRDKIGAAFLAAGEYETRLATRLIRGLQQLPGISIVGPTVHSESAPRVPTVSLRHESASPSDIASVLAERNIFVWSGHNYALETVRKLGLREEEGVLRIGIAHYNTEAEIERTLDIVADAVGR
ncbi:MAG TPA: cysteine desulfurase-like protein, partial [Woeseiaceae bacterium]|nr:cysteine desulfurase-like protein [Woeseiaceae bacterium]